MSSVFLRFSVGFHAARRSVRGVGCLRDKRLWGNFGPQVTVGALQQTPGRTYATNIKAQDSTTVKKFDAEDENEILEKIKNIFAEEERSGHVVPVFKKALLHGNKVAIKDQINEYTYHRLYAAAKRLSAQISNLCGSGSNARVTFLCPNDALYPVVQWACWFSGQVAVPLSTRHPTELLKYFVKDSESTLLITTPEYEAVMKPISEALQKVLIVIDHTFIPEIDAQSFILDPKNENVVRMAGQWNIEGVLSADFYGKSDAMILYTSGTTGNPKGVVLSHKNVNAQVNCLTDAWQFSSKDCLLHVLPLNHVHGCVNALMCPLSVGGKLIMQDHFDSHNVWSALLGINTPTKDRVNMFMGVPTIYNFLIDEYDKIFAKNSRMVEYIQNHCEKNIRLMISGSAPLPNTVFSRWYDISGHRLLERYGMTEIGMALSNPYVEDKVRQRKPGTVGLPLPGVEIRIADGDNKTLFTCKGEGNKGFWAKDEQPVYTKKPDSKSEPIIGELQVKGPNVFKEYYNRPEETKKEFIDGYFKTGDIACYDDGSIKIMGRSNVDIIKSGGFKISALEIETHILEHPSIKDVAVVGIPDDTWGERIAAIAVLRPNFELDLETLKVFCTDRVGKYAVPSVLKIIDEMPRNAMGKINKRDVIRLYFGQPQKQEAATSKATDPASENKSTKSTSSSEPTDNESKKSTTTATTEKKS